MKRLVFIIVVLGLALQLVMLAQQDLDSGGVLNIQATTHDSIRAWDTTIDTMVQSRELVAHVTHADPTLQDRQHETLVQYYQGVRVEGGSLSRQTSRGVTVSILGKLRTGIELNPVPGLSPVQALTMIQNVSGSTLVGADSPELIIFPRLIGTYALSYRATMSNAKTYYVDASSGAVLRTVDEFNTQRSVGTGTGALGDRKKVASKQAAGAFRTHDELRPASIRTYDMRGSIPARNRMLLGLFGGGAFDSDFPTDLDNTWTYSAAVDAHVHTGWTEDYFYKQQNWKGVDNQNSHISNIIGLNETNAYSYPPPYGPDGNGAQIYGSTPAGAPMSSLDVVAHELMHTVTASSLQQRTGNGLGSLYYFHPSGPTSVIFNGVSYACGTLSYNSGTETWPTYCVNGRYQTVSDQPKSINEAFSDVFGTATEFSFHAPGPGPLQGDYKMAEDITGLGVIRHLDIPQAGSLLGVPNPNHFTRAASYITVISQGTQAAPIALTAVEYIISDGQLIPFPFTVHFNSTILSHAFYLAIEGGQNTTSGRTVQGVGFANRAQIERAFFRAMTMLMPNVPSMQTAAVATYQAAIDLYGVNSAAAQAILQAMLAVGF